MALQIKDETAGIVVMEISGGAALIGIDGSADAVHILAVAGNPIIKSTGVIYDNTVVSSCGAPITGTATIGGGGTVVVTTSLGQNPIVQSADNYDTTTITFRGTSGANVNYRYW